MGKFNRPNFRDNRSNFRDKQMFSATCANCGKPCEVPFRPSGDKPVYCSDCFRSKRDNNPRERNDHHRRPDSNQNLQPQFSALSAKLDKIIGLLEGRTNTAPVQKEVKEPKKKPVVKKAAPKASKKTATKKAAPKKKK